MGHILKMDCQPVLELLLLPRGQGKGNLIWNFLFFSLNFTPNLRTNKFTNLISSLKKMSNYPRSSTSFGCKTLVGDKILTLHVLRVSPL